MIMNFNYPAVELTVAAGTTALMFTESGSILNSASSTIMSKTDALQANDGISPDGPEYLIRLQQEQCLTARGPSRS